MNVISSKWQPLKTNIMQELYGTQSACGCKRWNKIHAKSQIDSYAWNIAFITDEKRLQAKSFHHIPSVSSMFQACFKHAQSGSKVTLLLSQDPRWQTNQTTTQMVLLLNESWSLPTLLQDVYNRYNTPLLESILTGSKPLLKSHPNASLTEPAERRVRPGPLQLRSPLAYVMQTIADSLEFWLRAILSWNMMVHFSSNLLIYRDRCLKYAFSFSLSQIRTLQLSKIVHLQLLAVTGSKCHTWDRFKAGKMNPWGQLLVTS